MVVLYGTYMHIRTSIIHIQSRKHVTYGKEGDASVDNQLALSGEAVSLLT